MKNIFYLSFFLFIFTAKPVISSELSNHDLNIVQNKLCNRVQYSTIKNSFQSVFNDIQYLKYSQYNYRSTSQKMGVDFFILIDSYKIIEHSLSSVCIENSHMINLFKEAYLKDANEYCDLKSYLPKFTNQYMDETGFCYTSKRDLRRLKNGYVPNYNQ